MTDHTELITCIIRPYVFTFIFLLTVSRRYNLMTKYLILCKLLKC